MAAIELWPMKFKLHHFSTEDKQHQGDMDSGKIRLLRHSDEYSRVTFDATCSLVLSPLACPGDPAKPPLEVRFETSSG